MLINLSQFAGRGWHGLIPPQYLLSHKKFKKIALEPPNTNPGSWTGAGKALLDYETHTFWITARPRQATPIRGFAVDIYKSPNGEDFELALRLTREEIVSLTGRKINSIEGQQLLKDPTTNKYHLYLALDAPPGEGWDTHLLIADQPTGPWADHGIALARDKEFDSNEARDAIIDIVDGKYFCLYKANNGEIVRTALATSSDGKTWTKHGVFKIDGAEQPPYVMHCGKIMSGTLGPVFMGLKDTAVVHGASVSNTFVAYTIDYRNMNLETLFQAKWVPQSPYERQDYPIHSYMDMLADPYQNRILMYIEAIDPSDIGLNKEIDRVLLYEVPL